MDEDYNDVDYELTEETDGGKFRKAAMRAGTAFLTILAASLIKGVASVITNRDTNDYGF